MSKPEARRTMWEMLILCSLLLGACGTLPNPVGWRSTLKIAETSPQRRPVFLLNKNDPVFLWHDTATLHIQRAGKLARTLPLGHLPRQWSMYLGKDDQIQLLWIEQAAPDEARLYTALITPDLTLVRGPTEVSNANTTDYAAMVLPAGDLQTLWVSHAPGLVASLYAQTIDQQGRPQPAVLFARNAVHPAIAASSVQNEIEVAWLEPSIGNVWSIRSDSLPPSLTSISGNEPIGHSSEVGLIKLETGRILENFVVGVDNDYLYFLWSDTDVTTGSAGRVQVLPVEMSRSLNDMPLHQFTLADNLRWPSIPFAVDGGLALSLTAIENGRAAPAVAQFQKGQLASFTIFPTLPGTLGETALAAVPGQPLYIAWTVFQANGSTSIYYTQSQ